MQALCKKQETMLHWNKSSTNEAKILREVTKSVHIDRYAKKLLLSHNLAVNTYELKPHIWKTIVLV